MIKTFKRLAGVRPAVDFVTPQMAIGGRARAWRLRRAGITHVLNLRMSADNAVPGIVCLHNPTVDDGLEKGHKFWTRSVDFASAILTDPAARLYVHCKAGKHRSSGTVYAILRAQGYSPEDAWCLIRAARPKVRPRYVDEIDRHAASPQRESGV